jgi:hypothetical protein
MRLLRAILFFAVLAPVIAQDGSALKETRNRLHLIATRAIANFRSSETIEARLRQEGNSLHPRILAIRMRLEAALDDAEAALKAGKIQEANADLDRAEAWTDRFARLIGGD